MRRLPALVSVLLACGPAPAGPESGTGTPTTSQGDPSTTNLPTTNHTSGPGATESSAGGSTFLALPDLYRDPRLRCNPWAQDCPEGQKCAPWVPSGRGAFTDTKCVEIIGDQAPGESCTTPDGAFAGVDDCALGSFCWDVGADNHGICFQQCAGTSDAPLCPLKTSCGSDQHLVLALCFPNCDPILQDCAADELCLQNNNSFICVPDGSGDEGQANDPCEFNNGCDPGLVCLAPATASSNCAPEPSGCCQPFCLIPDGTCPNLDQQCLPLDPTPPGYEDLGICAVPK